MKHDFLRLRRLCALLLALVLTLPMGVATAWADTGDGFRVEIQAPNTNTALLDLPDLRSSTTLNAVTVGAVNGGTVTYRWTFTSDDGGAVTISPTSGATVTIKPVELGTGTITVEATCSWREQSGSTVQNKSVTDEYSLSVNITSIPLDALTQKSPAKPMKTGETQQLEVVYTPANATDKNVTWTVSSTPSGVVDVAANGEGTAEVRALKEGTATITARGSGGALTMFQVVVTDAATPEVTVTPEQDDIPTLVIGETYQLLASVTATPAPAETSWRSSSPTIATVSDSGLVTCLRAGTVTLTYTAKGTNNKTVTVTRRITIIDPKNMIANSMSAKGPTSLSLSGGEQTQLGVNVSPATANVTWSSDNPSVASVEPATGKVTAVASGKANITATAQKADGTLLTVTYEITVMGRAIDVSFNTGTNVNVDRDSGRLYTQFNSTDGRTRTLYTTLQAENGEKTNTYIVFTSSDTSVVTATAQGTTGVELGIPSTRKPGEATITATVYDNTTKQPVLTSDGRTPMAAEIDVIVSGFELSESSVVMYEGEAKALSVTGSYGEARDTTATNVQWSSTDSSIVSMEGGTLNAWAKGTATVTATTRDGKYKATCTVTVSDDPGTIVNAGSAAAGNSIQLGTASVRSQLNSVAQQRLGGSMSYITSIFISPTQGVVYNSYTSEADTGKGVSMQERYTVSGTGPTAVEALYFVPNKSYSGEARISYIGYSNGQPISGIISVNVTGMGESGSDVTYTANAAPVTFQAEDFNIICNNKTGRSLKYVTFTPPQSSVGALYENYVNDVHPGQLVVGTTQYNRTGTPNLSSLTFVPADGYTGAAKISYRATDSANNTYTGTVTVNVNKAASYTDPADIYYTAPQDGWATFQAADFANASLRVIGETLSHVRFALPDSSEGTLFYNYRGFGNYDSAVASTTNYYRAGTPTVGAVTFVPASTSSGRTAITYTGYSTRGTTFTGKVYVGEGVTQPGTTPSQTYYDYTVNSGSTVTLNVNTFNTASVSATGATLDYIRFSSLPTTTQGTLRYRTGSSTTYNAATTSTSFYRTSANSTTPLIGNISFQANATYTGVVRIPYTGYNTNGSTFTGEVTIQVTPNTIIYTGTTASPIRLSSSRVRSAVSGTFTNELSYIEFTSLPDSSAGRVYLNYNGYNTGSQASTGTRYYASSTPSIDQISFVPKGRFEGDATVTYIAYSTSGEQLRGQIVFRISAASSSSYFVDMGNYGWAAASVDYLYQNGVTNGMTANTYGPSQQILRRDFVLMLYRAFQFSGGSAASPGFADVPAYSYYAQAVSAAKQLGIANGDGTNFMPATPITRQDAMVMVKNAMTAAGKLQGAASTSVLNNFPDGTAVSSYAREAVSTLVQMGAVNGSNGMLNPRSYITRAEAAVILHFVMTA